MSTREAISRNLKLLMDDTDMDQWDVAKRSGVAQTTVSNLLRIPEADTEKPSPTLRTIENIAGVFGIPAWLLLVPGISVEHLKSREIETLVACFLAVGPEAKANLIRIAQNEVRYAKDKL